MSARTAAADAHPVASAASSASCLATISLTAFMLRSARCSRLGPRARPWRRASSAPGPGTRARRAGRSARSCAWWRPGWPTRGPATCSSRSRRTASAAARSARTAMSAVPIEPRPLSLTKSIISAPPSSRRRPSAGRRRCAGSSRTTADAELDVLVGLLPGLGDVHQPDEAPLARGRRRCRTSPPAPPSRPSAGRAASKPAAWVAPIDSRPMPYRPARRGPDGRGDGGHGDVEQRVRVRAQVQAGVDEVPHLGLAAHRLLGASAAA